ncbi:hypothetical protein ABW21_db0201393 [Orbilia brochopaga]|nr:hypothetical protein ABW21_db0201393 [Drechslerella brochopaga]
MSAVVKREREISPPLADLSAALSISPKIENDGNEDVTPECTENPKKKQRKAKATTKAPTKQDGGGESKVKRGAWTDEQDSALQALITNHQGGNEVKAPWSDIFERFTVMYPEADKTLNSLQMRWKVKLRDGDTDLTFAELLFETYLYDFRVTPFSVGRGKCADISRSWTYFQRILFKQAVANIDGNERALAYAWRFKELSGKGLNKSAAIKLHKMLKSGQLGVEDWQVKSG